MCIRDRRRVHGATLKSSRVCLLRERASPTPKFLWKHQSLSEFVKESVWRPSEIKLCSPRSGFGALIINDELYVCGGNDGNNALRVFESYNFKTKSWKSLPPLKFKRDELSLVLGHDGRLYAIGGFGGPTNTCLNSVERYDFTKGQWEMIASLNTWRRALAAVTLPDGIYAIGGFDGQQYLCTVERFDESKNEWSYVGSMNYARCTFAAVTSPDGQHIYAIGGFDNGPLQSVERYSVINDSWEIIAPLQYKRFMHSAVLTHK
eukprot:TRINITY_DN12935_c0_g1_i1.p1 TRINITY_DN12935_c0_g1~~TRINITY_DN12935_c0_g1_i1.p1  ORF type:complete len:282 (-),score=50.23 TRINITY_DN12935_c0_g1_i1:373-1158(-)